MIQLTCEELVGILSSARLEPSFNPTLLTGGGLQGIEFDSRNVKPGNIFVALKGAEAHGEQYLDQAFEKGASLALVEDRELIGSFPDRKLIAASSSLKAFWSVANWWRLRSQAAFVAITGSVGKTTTKEMLAKLLALKAKGSSSQKSFNNHTGVPYTVCQVAKDDKWAIIEMGMNHPGELSDLSKIVNPHVAVVTRVAPVHIGFFNSVSEIAKAKCEVFDGLVNHGLCVVNDDDKELQVAFAELGKGKECVRTFGTDPMALMRISGFKSRGLDGIQFQLEHEDQSIVLKMGLLGYHNAYNVACAALTARVLFPPFFLTSMKSTLDTFQPPQMRMNLKSLSAGRKLIDDSYNASPPSMSAAIELLKELKEQGKKVGAVLGDMRELGKHSDHYHAELAKEVISAKLDFVVTVGNDSKVVSTEGERAGIQAVHASSTEEAAEIVSRLNFDVLLVKGSRAMSLDKTVSALMEILKGSARK